MPSPLRRPALRGVALAARARDRLRPPPAGTVLLIYHRVGATTPVPVDLPAADFRAQMEAVAEVATTLDDALEREEPAADGRNPVVVTFDDGTADVVDVAVPILVECGVTALLYVATRFVDEGRSFPDEGRPASWGGLADALSTGRLQVGSHTHSHALLDRVDGSIAADELDRSIGLIEEHLQVTPAHFAYPKALLGSPSARAEVAARFESAAVAGTRPNPFGATDPQQLARSPIKVSDQGAGFAAKAAGGMALEDDLRRVANRLRYRGATT